jgi:hypothetical protein
MALEDAWREADIELSEALADTTLRRRLGDRFHEFIEARVVAEESAGAAYRVACRASADSEITWGIENLDSDDPEAVGADRCEVHAP